MLPSLLLCLLVFSLVIFGLGWPLARKLRLDGPEKICATVGISLILVYLAAFAFYLLNGPRVMVAGTSVAAWTLPLAAVLGLIIGRRELAELRHQSHVRALLLGQALIWAWCVGWLSLVISYSGGGWAGDWFEHWQRARFFIEHWPLDAKFIAVYPLTARPPLANLVTGAFLDLSGVQFPFFQLVTTLLNGLVFLPAALLARRFAAKSDDNGAARTAIALLTVLLMLNPSFMENATFSWTKLMAAFYVLSGLYFFLRAGDPAAPVAAGVLCAASLAAGLLTHYSAGPCVVLLAVAWFARDRARWRESRFWQETLRMTLTGAALLATWFIWSIATYGVHLTTAANTSVAEQSAGAESALLKMLLNLRDTVVPHFLRTVDHRLIDQVSQAGSLRDWFFQLYQVNLLFVFGSVAWLVITLELARVWRSNRRPRTGLGQAAAMARSAPPGNEVGAGRGFWLWFIAGAIVLGVIVTRDRDHWGLAHICLQSLVALGLAFLSARWATLSRSWRGLLIAGAVADFALGIALQFAVEAYAVDRWLHPELTPLALVKGYSASATMNFMGKVQNRLAFLADVLPSGSAIIVLMLGAILALALLRARRGSAS